MNNNLKHLTIDELKKLRNLKYNDQEYDITIYSIVKYFQLAMENNPNIIDSLFTPANCVTHSTQIGNMVRENKELFLHKGSFHKFKGYAFSTLNKLRNRNLKGINDLIEFEKENNISHETSKEDVEYEMKKRGLS